MENNINSVRNGIDDEFSIKVKEIIGKLTLDEKMMLLTTHHHAVKRLGLGEFYIGTEVARGFVGRDKEHISTVFPQPVGLASTFDTELMHELGEIAGNESRAYYNEDKRSGLALWGPTVDPVRNPLWGRTEEAYGEDVYLAGEMTKAYTLGMAGDDEKYIRVIPTLKHFCANNNEQDRDRCNAVVPKRIKHEYYYAAFKTAIKYGGARSVMAAYNEINGVPAICNNDLNNILKDEWGLWFVVSDGADFSQNVTAHKFCQTHSEALKLALEAGCDSMTDNDELVKAAAQKALDSGLITECDIDKSLFNTLYARFRLGQFDEKCPFDSINKEIIDNDKYKAANLRAAKEQVVLLKNDGILPIKEKNVKIAVVGALCDENLMDWYTGYSSGDISVLEGIRCEFGPENVVSDSLWDYVSIKAPNGKYLSAKENGDVIADADSVTDSELFELQNWGENWNNLFSCKFKRYVRLFDDNTFKLHGRRIFDWFTRETLKLKNYRGKVLIEEALFSKRVFLNDGGRLSTKDKTAADKNCLFEISVESTGKERARKIAKACDYVIYCVGNYPVQVAKECHDRKTLSLNVQENMAQVLLEKNKNTVMVLISSYPYAICSENEILPGIIYSSHAGMFLGTAVAQTLSGKNNPAGRLALTWYKSEHELPDIMSYDIEKSGLTYMYFDGEPLYCFGHGLSYSEFEYDKFEISQSGGRLYAQAEIKNTSEVDGSEVVQIYFNVKDSKFSRPELKLCGFKRVFIKSGETKCVKIEIFDYILQVFDVRASKFITESGEYEFFAAASSNDIRKKCVKFLSGQTISKRKSVIFAEDFDSYEHFGIFYSKTFKAHYIRVCGWSADASYSGIDLSGKSRIKIRASSINSPQRLSISIGGQKYEIDVAPSDAYDDFKLYEISLIKSDLTDCELKVSGGEGIGILKFEFI